MTGYKLAAYIKHHHVKWACRMNVKLRGCLLSAFSVDLTLKGFVCLSFCSRRKPDHNGSQTWSIYFLIRGIHRRVIEINRQLVS